LNKRNVLSPENLDLIATIDRTGSMAAAARELNMVPSAMSYRVRQMEESLDVLLFDRSSRTATLTAAGEELLQSGQRMLEALDALAARLKRVATGWEPRFTIAVDSLIASEVVLDLCEQFISTGAPTQIRLLSETLSGTYEALSSGRADLALGGVSDSWASAGFSFRTLGDVRFIFAVAPLHPLAKAKEPLQDDLIYQYLAIAVADSANRGPGMTVGLLPGQAVLTVPDMPAKLAAQLRGLGCGFLPECLAAPYLAKGALVQKQTERPSRLSRLHYAWRSDTKGGLALRWWRNELSKSRTRSALLSTPLAD
jgi:molybdate transport repressor ModE-like protein